MPVINLGKLQEAIIAIGIGLFCIQPTSAASGLSINFLPKLDPSQDASVNLTTRRMDNLAPTAVPGPWVSFPAPGEHTLLSAAFPAEDHGWAVGLAGQILEWNGNEWKRIESGVVDNLHDIDCLTENDCWVVGTRGMILHWDGSAWRMIPSPTHYDLYSVDFLNHNLGWIAGGMIADDIEHFTANRIILKWDGNSWKRVPTPYVYPLAFSLDAIAMVDENDGWATGTGNLLHWNGTRWLEQQYLSLPDPEKEISFKSIAVLSKDDIWMVGDASSIDAENAFILAGAIYHWDGKQWKEVKRTTLPLSSITMVNPVYGWAVGGDDQTNIGRSILLFWNGTDWEEIPTPAHYPLQFVWMKDTNHGWLFSGGTNPNSGFEGEVFRYQKVNALPTPSSTVTRVATPSQTPSANPDATSTVRVTAISTVTNIPATVTPYPPTSIPQSRQSQANATQISIIVLMILGIAAVFLILYRRRRS